MASTALNELHSPPDMKQEEDHHEEEVDESADSHSGSPKRGSNKKKRDSSSLRKAPQAPKRFKSSYICFFMAKQPEIKNELGDKSTVTEISKRSAEMWRNLPAEDRAHWDDVAAKDKQRYMVEKASYTGPWQVPWKRAKKDPSAPKRPMSAFLYFSQGRRRTIKESNQDLKNTEVSRLLGGMWRKASEEERKPYIEKEKKERAKYKVAIADWRKDYEARKAEEQRKQKQQESLQQQAQWAQPYNPEVGDAQSPQMQYAQPPYMPPPPPGYHQYPPQPYGYPAYPPPPAYHYPSQYGKQPVILGPNGMPHFQPMAPPQQQPPPMGVHPYQEPQLYEDHQAPGPPQLNYDYIPSPEPQAVE